MLLCSIYNKTKDLIDYTKNTRWKIEEKKWEENNGIFFLANEIKQAEIKKCQKKEKEYFF